MKRNLYAFKENHIEDVLASFSCSLVYLKRPTNEIYTTDLYIVDSCQSEANGKEKEKEAETNAALKLLHIVEYPNVNRSNAWKFERWKLHSVCMSWSNTSGQNVWQNARTDFICKSHFTAKEIETLYKRTLSRIERIASEFLFSVSFEVRFFFIGFIRQRRKISQEKRNLFRWMPPFFILHICECTLRSLFYYRRTHTHRIHHAK